MTVNELMCEHDWTELFTDRDSPESYEPGTGYRGWRFVGYTCRRCGEHRCVEPRPFSPKTESEKDEVLRSATVLTLRERMPLS